MLKIKPGFLLRKLGDEYLVVAIGSASKELCGMIRMNATGAFFWNALAVGTTEDAMVQNMLEHYNGLDEQTARHDLKRFLETVAPAIEEI